ncbi:APC family permease [Pseudonocardia humida]|uniref:APC family permease n=1 Tax=Pseudonocardia humida TaxID=2800819 RepID=A0ABT0ZZF9_9PSEU|nr:APC family permease [Pseudonocardia humida]MCO1656138.1 APC family permease [Pseudonocardia humida]
MAERTSTRRSRGPAGGDGLAPDRLGVAGIVFFVVAAAAPLVGMTGAVPVAIAAGSGAGAPGAYVAVGITLIIFSSAFSAMSRVVTNTGAFFAYVGRGLGIPAGVGSALVSVLAYLAIQLAVYGFFGAVLAGQMAATAGVDLPWWVWSLLAWAVVLGLSLISVEIGAKVLGVLMICELLSLVVVAFAVIGSGGGPDGLDLAASFAPQNVFVGGLVGSAGIALAFAFASFIGFEATAIYGEESRDPERTVPRATYLAVGLITVIFALAAFAVVSGLGASGIEGKVAELSTVDGTPLADPAAVLFGVAATYVGDWLATVMSWLVVSSLFAGLLAFQNCSARYFFSLGRAGVLPAALHRTNGRGAPATGSIATSVLTGLVIVVFALAGLDPVLNLFYWTSGLAVISVVVVEILVCVAVLAYFGRSGRERHWWSTTAAPILAGLGLLTGLYLLISRFGLLAGTVPDGVDPSTTPWTLSATGWTLVLLPFVVLVAGVVLGTVVRGRGDRNRELSAILG